MNPRVLFLVSYLLYEWVLCLYDEEAAMVMLLFVLTHFLMTRDYPWQQNRNTSETQKRWRQAI